jgi:hypothetical protein
LTEVDNAAVPRQLSEMREFTFFYEAIVKWAVSISLEAFHITIEFSAEHLGCTAFIRKTTEAYLGH